MTMNSFDPLFALDDSDAAGAVGFKPLTFGTQAAPATAPFIPREQLHEVTPWQPLSFDEPAPRATPHTAPPAPPPDVISAEERAAELEAVRQAAHAEGMHAGLSALDAYKRNHGEAMAAQMQAVCDALQQRFDALEQTLADRVADVALALARQVVRDEIRERPQLLVTVAREALDTLMASARHIALRVHPDDHALVTAQLQERLTAQNIRLVADAALERGDCRVESDIGSVDASVATRWRRAAAAMGRASDWHEQEPSTAAGEPA